MVNTLARIFGTKKVIDTGMRGIDALIFTPEEKSNYKLKLLDTYRPYELVLRLISISVVYTYLFCFTIVLGTSFFIDVTKQIEMMGGSFGLAFIAVITFYFGNMVAKKFRTDKKDM